MKVRDFRNHIVQPCIDEFLSSPDSVHRIASATWALDGYASHIYYGGCVKTLCKDDTEYKRHVLIKESYDFLQVFEMAKALKHGTLTRSSSRIRSSSDLRYGELEGWSWYLSGADAPGEQFYTHPEGKLSAGYSDALLKALEFLDRKAGN